MADNPVASTSLPQVTVIVCTYDRADNLRKCLESVSEQDYPARDILVVYRPSEKGNDDTEKVSADFGAKLIRQDGKGIANARNLGVRAATTEYIAFIDDDCTAAPDWLRKLMTKMLGAGVSGVSGTALTEGTGAVEFRNGTVDIYGRGRCRNREPGRYDRPGGNIYNNIVCMNVALRRPAVIAVGGFDEYFNYFYEETDLAIRMIHAGYRILHEPDAIVYHNSTTDPGRQSRQLYNISRNTTCMPFKNFRQGFYRRVLTLTYLYVRRMATFVIPLAGGKINPGEFYRICADITRGFGDGMRDGLAIVRHR